MWVYMGELKQTLLHFVYDIKDIYLKLDLDCLFIFKILEIHC